MQSQESQMTRPSGHRPPTRYTVFSGIDIRPDVGRRYRASNVLLAQLNGDLNYVFSVFSAHRKDTF